MSRAAVLLGIALLLPLVPPAASEGDSLVLRAPRDGDVARVTYAWEDSVYGSGSFERTYRWSGPIATYTDTFGIDRATYRLTISTVGCLCQGDGEWVVEATSNLPIATARSWASGPFKTHPSPGWERTFAERHAYENARGESDPYVALMGHTLAAEWSLVVTEPQSPWGTGRWGSREYVAQGWGEDGLFRVHATGGWRDPLVLTFDGASPVPMQSIATRTYGDGRVLRYITTLVAFEPGEGAPLVAPEYVPGHWPDAAADVARTTYTADGPAEEGLPAFPLAQAAAVARADPRVARWLEERPTAYVVAGVGEHPLEGKPSWTIEFGTPYVDGGNLRLLATVAIEEGLLGGPVVKDVVERGEYRDAYSLAGAARTPRACAAASEAGAWAMLGGPQGPLGRKLDFRLYGDEIVCETTLTIARDGHGGDVERTTSAKAKLQGVAGWVGERHRVEVDGQWRCTQSAPLAAELLDMDGCEWAEFTRV